MSALASLLRLGPLTFERAGCVVTIDRKTGTLAVVGDEAARDRVLGALASTVQSLPLEVEDDR